MDKFEQDILNKLSNEGQEQDQTEVTPRFGFVYEINDSVSLYTSYAEGFRPNPGLDSNRNAFDPEETTSFEVGAKWENIADMFSGSVAIFDAEKTNMLTAEPNTGFSATLGEVESQGVEFQLTTDLTSDIRLDMAYAYIDAKTAKGESEKTFLNVISSTGEFSMAGTKSARSKIPIEKKEAKIPAITTRLAAFFP